MDMGYLLRYCIVVIRITISSIQCISVSLYEGPPPYDGRLQDSSRYTSPLSEVPRTGNDTFVKWSEVLEERWGQVESCIRAARALNKQLLRRKGGHENALTLPCPRWSPSPSSRCKIS